MSSARAILQATKAMPGAARYTPAPQGGPYSSGMSPLVAQMNSEHGYTSAYPTSFLPRPSATFTEGAFGPFSPILPTPVDQPPPFAERPEPRRWDYETGWNLPTPPGMEGLKLVSFDTLRTIADLYCVNPEALTLCSDLIWRPIGKIHVGDELLAFDEKVPGPRKNRKFRYSTVTSCDRIVRPCYKITFVGGRQVIASAEHQWLAGRLRGDGPQRCPECNSHFMSPGGVASHRRAKHDIRSSHDQDWVITADLRPGATVKDLGVPWETDDSRDAAYLAGILDGEGSLSSETAKGSGYFVQIAQNPGLVLDEAERIIKERGHRYKHLYGKLTVDFLQVSGIYDSLRLLGEIRPLRLLSETPRWLEGRTPFPHIHSATRSVGLMVESIDFLGDQEVVAIGTSTNTLFIEGLFSHNSVARTCVQLRKSEIQGLDWDIIPSHAATKAYHGDRDAMRDFAERRAKVVKFFRHPDPDYFSFGSWIGALMEEVFVFDALSILIRPKWGKGMGKGLLGSDLDSLQLISGQTIRPLVDLWGSIPRPPAPAYQQFIKSVPRSDFMTIITQRDLDEGGLRESDLETYRGDQLLYLPMVTRRWTPYGFPPIERALLPIMSGLAKQSYQYNYFKEGTVPEVFVSPGDMNLTPNQLRELQDALNAFAGDPAWKHKVIVLPPGSRTEPMKTKEIADQFDEIVMSQVTMAFDVNPMEIGLLPRVSTVASPFAAREMAQATKTIHERVSTKPTLKFIADIFDNILHRVVGQDDMKFTFEGLQEEAEANAATQMLVQQVQSGIRSVDEARDELELEPWGLPETSGPVFFSPQGPIPFGQVPIDTSGQAGQADQANTSEPGTAGSSETFNQTTGIPGNLGPELTPAHESARAFMNEPSVKPGGGSPTDNKYAVPITGKNMDRAQRAELETLARHLKNGRDVDSWQVKNVPAYAPALLAQELQKGSTRTEAVDAITQLITGATDYEWSYARAG